LSKRTTPQGLDELFGVPMSGGRISPSEKITTEVIADAVQEARGHVEAQSVAPLDATDWREGLKRAGLWVAVTPRSGFPHRRA
jgi:hypothetical protein